MNRREFAASLLPLLPYRSLSAPSGAEVNDVHSQLNPTLVDRIETPESLDSLRQIVAGSGSKPVVASGSRHAMGGQQFVTGGVVVDMRRLDRVLRFDQESGLIEVEAGLEWPGLASFLLRRQSRWGFAQKQTGADKLTLGGALSSNIHGRGLRMRPFIADIESFNLVDARGRLRSCSRRQNAELFRLAIGGYGLFGAVYSVALRLAPRRKLARVVEIATIDELMRKFDERIAAGFLYGDFQYAIDPASDDFLRRGVFSCYRPVDESTPVPDNQIQLSDESWFKLLLLAHADKTRAFKEYASFYLSTNGQIYWSDTHQMSFYPEGYHAALDSQLSTSTRATEMITEIYVPRPRLADFMADAAKDLRANGAEVIYGTIRLIERDTESVLAWAREPWACVIFNLHVVHTAAGIERAAAAFRALIDRAIERGGSYFLTYHRWATRNQLEAAHPRIAAFLRLKRKHDPVGRFQSDWYRHYRGAVL